jgi:AcrR family transcriptional regulator
MCSAGSLDVAGRFRFLSYDRKSPVLCKDVAVTAAIGRPRLLGKSRPGDSAADEILDAAAELFTVHGFAATSTRMIAEAVGVKQATLYYYFARKQDILAALLVKPMQPALAHARSLARLNLPPHLALYSLARLDAATLVADRYNIAALYSSPELRLDWMAEVRRQQAALRRAYRRPIQAGFAAETFRVDSVEVATSLSLALVESVITMRTDGVVLEPATVPQTVATSVLRTLRCPEELISAAHNFSDQG